MKDFLQSRKFKALLVILAMLTAFLFRAAYTGGLPTVVSGVSGILVRPFTSLSSAVSGKVQQWLAPYLNAAEISRKNEELTEQVRKLTEQLVDYDTYKNENALYREYLEIKEYNEDFVFEPASVIGRSADNRYGSFTIDAGSYHGVHLRDPVITADGLVGVVTQLGYVNSTVSTLLDLTVSVGAKDARTLDTGTVSGDSSLYLSGKCKLANLSRESGAAVGDIIVTSGISGLYPAGLIIGSIDTVESEADGLSLYAAVTPAADIENATSVFVITDFAGKSETMGE